jgi:hypothetical protein
VPICLPFDLAVHSSPKAPGRGSATEAAGSIAAVLSSGPDPAVDPSMRAEEFTLAKEQRTKDLGAEIITGSFRVGERGVPSLGEEPSPWLSVRGQGSSSLLWGTFVLLCME